VSPGSLLMSPHIRAIEEGHSELHATLLHQVQQSLPDTPDEPSE
jgi:hypothetical protein